MLQLNFKQIKDFNWQNVKIAGHLNVFKQTIALVYNDHLKAAGIRESSKVVQNGFDDASLATVHLVENSYQDIAFIGYPAMLTFSKQRLRR